MNVKTLFQLFMKTLMKSKERNLNGCHLAFYKIKKKIEKYLLCLNWCKLPPGLIYKRNHRNQRFKNLKRKSNQNNKIQTILFVSLQVKTISNVKKNRIMDRKRAKLQNKINVAKSQQRQTLRIINQHNNNWNNKWNNLKCWCLTCCKSKTCHKEMTENKKQKIWFSKLLKVSKSDDF